MVNLRFGYTDDTVLNTDGLFDIISKQEWFADPFVVQMVESVDKCRALDEGVFTSPVMPTFSRNSLSAGAKTLVLLYHRPEYEYLVTNCGDNCAKWILEIGRRHDISICLTYIMDFGDHFDIVLGDLHITSMPELIRHFKEKYYDQFPHLQSKV